MSVSFFQISRWYRMLTGQSVWHVNQDIGKFFTLDHITGYYNNMTEKVTKIPKILVTEQLPQLNLGSGKSVLFPVAIFQYGLGAYDLYLQTKEEKYHKKFIQCSMWALEHIDDHGRWNNFFYIYPNAPYGAMAQGEGASLLIRAYLDSSDVTYLEKAKIAIDFMLKPIEEGGTTDYKGNDVIMREYTHLPCVMNGWIFAWWGLYDYVLITHDEGKYKNLLNQSCNTLIKSLYLFKNSFWSLYDLGGKIASPFYHNLHIAQMQAMYQLTGIECFKDYADRWSKQQSNPICKFVAFLVKSYQKILE